MTEFSNSLIIHREKTKEFTTVKEVWICDPNIIIIKFCKPLLSIPLRVINALRSYIKHVKESSFRYPNLVKTIRLCLGFSPIFSVFGNSDETLFLVFEILLAKHPSPLPFMYITSLCDNNHIIIKAMDV